MNDSLTQRVAELETELAKKNEEIDYLEKLVDAHDRLEELSRSELVDAERTIEAQENLQYLLRQERQDADKIIKAHQSLAELSALEKQSADEIIKAHEQVLSLSRLEIKQADDTIRAQEEISKLSSGEIQQRDLALRTILETGRQLSAILDRKRLFEGIAKGLEKILGTDRVAIFNHQTKHRLTPVKLIGLKVDDLTSIDFGWFRNLIKKVASSRQGVLEANRLGVPLVHDGKLLGVLYAERSDQQRLRPRDLEMAEIFSLQVSVAMHNSLLYHTIRNRNNELLRLINLKDTLAQRISEEVQKPVTQIDKALRDFEGRYPSKSDLDKIRLISSRAVRLVDRLTDMKSLEEEAGQIFADRIEFDRLVEAILERHGEKIAERDLNLKISLAEKCNGYQANEHIMRSIFDELISNAIYYNRAGGSIFIKGRRTREYLVFIISDTGVGIAPENIERVFGQFERTEDSFTLNPAGAGLGLFMIQTFLKYYGGAISARSQVGRGTKFTVTFLRH